jgi:hypothetical protein
MPIPTPILSNTIAGDITLTADELAIVNRNSDDNAKYIERLTEYINNPGAAQRKPIVMCQEPNSLKLAGVNAKKVTITPKVIDKCMASVPTDKINHPHNLDENIMRKLVDEIRNPALIMHSITKQDSLVVVTGLKDKENHPVVVALAKGKQGESEICAISSAYGKTHFANWLKKFIDQNKIIACNKEKSNDLFRFLPERQFVPEEQQIITYNDSIAYSLDSVKGFDKNILQNSESVKKGKPISKKTFRSNPAYEEKIVEARGADLVSYFEKRGYEIDKEGSEFYIKGIPGLCINPEKGKWFSHYENIGGSNSIDCLTKVMGIDFKRAVEELSGGRAEDFSFQTRNQEANKSTANLPKKEKEFVLPEVAENNNRVIAYLTKTRKIPPEIVFEFIRNKKLYQEKNTGNAVFPHYKNGKIIGAEMEGTGSYSRFKKSLTTPNENSAFAVAFSQKTTKAYVFESAIDLMSFYSMVDRQKNNLDGVAFVSMAGLKPSIIKEYESRGIEILSCVDNDEKGRKFENDNGFKRAGTMLEDEGAKDWNDFWKMKVDKSINPKKDFDVSKKNPSKVVEDLQPEIEEIEFDE